jgi:DNA polymerase-3 subunit delta
MFTGIPNLGVGIFVNDSTYYIRFICIFVPMAKKGKVSFEELMKDLENKDYLPVYILHGEEPYYIDVVSDFIEDSILSESEKEFNQSVLYGRDLDVPTIVSYAKRFPMMAPYQVLIVKEAQDLDKIEELEEYMKNPVPTSILVLCHKHKKLDQRKAFVKNAVKNGVVYYSERLYDSKVPQWISSFLRNKGYQITPKASMLLTEYLGSDLGKIANELEKIFINVAEGAEINDIIIEENIGISKDYNIFELQNALGTKNVFKANQICNYFAANPKEHPIVRTLAMLYVFFMKLLIYHGLEDKSRQKLAAELGVHSFFVKDYITAAQNYPYQKIEKIVSDLSEYDLRSKGYGDVSTPQGELLRELIYKILH